jgi:hypothetical protein
MVKTYDLIKNLLTKYPELRDSDKKLIWAVWQEQGLVGGEPVDYISYDNFMKAENMETIRRTRQKLQETFCDLRGSLPVQKIRREKMQSKGTFIYREKTPIFDETERVVRFQ